MSRACKLTLFFSSLCTSFDTRNFLDPILLLHCKKKKREKYESSSSTRASWGIKGLAEFSLSLNASLRSLFTDALQHEQLGCQCVWRGYLPSERIAKCVYEAEVRRMTESFRPSSRVSDFAIFGLTVAKLYITFSIVIYEGILYEVANFLRKLSIRSRGVMWCLYLRWVISRR